MSDVWRVSYDALTGEPRSIGTDPVAPRDGCAVAELSDEQAAALISGEAQWSAAARSVVPVVPPPLPPLTADQLLAWMRLRLGLTDSEIEAAIREAAEI